MNMGVTMYHIGICDDDKNFCEELSEMLRGITEELHTEIVLETWYSCEDLCAFLDAGNSCVAADAESICNCRLSVL